MALASIVQEMTDAADLWHNEYVESEGEYNPEALAVVMMAIREHRNAMADLFKRVEADYIARAERRLVVDGIGEFEVRRNIKRTAWDNEGLTAVLVARALDERVLDEATGEYEPREQAVARVLSECARPSWRVTPLRARGIDETEFCEVSEDGVSVQLPKARP